MMNDIRPDAMCIQEFWVVEPDIGTYRCVVCDYRFEHEVIVNWDENPPYVEEETSCPKCDCDAALVSTHEIYVDGI